jgi:hypothetical protein
MNQPNYSPNSQPPATDTAAVVVALGQMFRGFRERTDDAEAMTKTYVGALDDLPVWAVVKACERFRRGMVADRKSNAFSPSTAELHAYAEKLVEDDELHQRRMSPPRMLPPPKAPEITAEERAASAARVEAEVARLKASGKESDEAQRLRAERADRLRELRERVAADVEAECAAEGVDAYDGGPIPVSMALRRLMRRDESAA